MNITKSFITCFLLIANIALAQDQPKTQRESVWLDNIKIDGVVPNHDKFFKAYNHSDHLFYTVANDDKNLYLIIYCNERLGLGKLVYGGVTLSITDAADQKRSVSVTYPLTDYKQNFPVARFSYNYYADYSRDKEKNKEQIAQLKKTLTNLVSTNFKEIALQGIDAISAQTISVYNEDGIKAIVGFDDEIALTYEMVIPLKYLKISGNKILYNIRLNGRVMPKPNPMAPPPPHPADGSTDMTGLYLDTPSNFGGEYKLAKK